MPAARPRPLPALTAAAAPLAAPAADIAGAPPLAAPESLALPDAFQNGETPEQAVEVAPARRSLARPVKDNEPWLKERQNRKLGRREFAERYTQNAPEMRQILVQGGWPSRGKAAAPGAANATQTESVWENEDATPAPRAETAPAPATPKGTPTVLARVSGPDDSPDWVPDGMGRGRCGGCDTIILAPQERPIQLKCPKCNRVTLLQ